VLRQASLFERTLSEDAAALVILNAMLEDVTELVQVSVQVV